ncbi:unnamed protein product [Sympodiomycopsis kandeliae]
MGNSQSSANRIPLGAGSLVAELGDDGVRYEKSMGSSRFLKAVKARHTHGPIVVKTFIKPDASLTLRHLVRRLRTERETLADVPNVLTYQKVIENEKAGYLIRQWLASSLYDRISTRPFLSVIEKKWITYQLLSAMKGSRDRKIPHGDLKSENILVTSSMSVYVTDFAASFKPTYLPLDDPADFSFFFDTSGRRTCYVAPERFYAADSEIARQKVSIRTGTSASNTPTSAGNTSITSSGDPYGEILGLGKRDGKVTEAMDVFSLGCVIAELWRDGAPMFTLSQLFKYRERFFDIGNALGEISDPQIREMVRTMLSLEPDHRLTFAEHFEQRTASKAFPPSFSAFLHDYLVDLQRYTPSRGASVGHKSQVPTSDSTAQPQAAAGSVSDSEHRNPTQDPELEARQQADFRLEQLFEDWSVIMSHIDTDSGLKLASPEPTLGEVNDDVDNDLSIPGNALAAEQVLPVQLSIPGIRSSSLADHVNAVSEDGSALLILSPLLSNLRNALRPTSKLHALDMLLYLSAHSLTDETKLDRVLPYLVAMYDDSNAQVRSAALRSTAQLLMLVGEINHANETVCPEYCFPNIRVMSTDPCVTVRVTYASCFPWLINVAQRFLQQSQALRASGVFAAEEDAADEHDARLDDGGQYDAQLQDIKAFAQEQMTQLLTDGEPSVKRALIDNLAPLCQLFGMATTNDVLLSHMITYLNDRDWLLRDAFFDSIADVALVAGERSVTEYIVPLMLQALADGEEFVVVRVLRGLSKIASASLLKKTEVHQLLSETSGFLCYPNIWIKQAAADFLVIVMNQMEAPELWSIGYPAIRPLLKHEVQVISSTSLLGTAKPPLARHLLQAALNWASASSKSSFWPSSQDEHGHPGVADRIGFEGLSLIAKVDNNPALKAPLRRSEEDDAFMDKLRGSGLGPEEEIKLLALRSHIWKLSKQARRQRSNPLDAASTVSGLPRSSSQSGVQHLDGITPQTIFFTYNGLSSTAGHDQASQVHGSVRSPTITSFADQVAKKRLTGERVASAGSFGGHAELLRKRINVAAGSPESSARRPDSNPLLGAKVPNATLTGSPRSVSSNQARLVSNKGAPAVAESSTNATGTMTDLTAKLQKLGTTSARPQSPGMSGSNTPGLGPDHSNEIGPLFRSTYQGTDPYIEAHLEAVFVRNFRERSAELGPRIAAGSGRRRTARNISGSSAKAVPSGSSRRPEGKLIAYFDEHLSAVTALAVSTDYLFFASGSEDGTVKIWDTARLEKNVTSRSRATYSGHSGKITALIALDTTHCLVSASSDGSLHVWRVEVSSGSLPKYGKPRLISNFQLSHPGEFVTCLLQSSSDSPSAKLILGTSASRIVILDLRTMQVLQALQKSPHFGPITCMCADKKRSWLLCGTMSGNLVVWDLRFGLLIKSWAVGDPSNLQSRCRVTRCSLHPSKGRGRWVMISYIEDPIPQQNKSDRQPIVETWDIDRGVMVESFEVSHSKTGINRVTSGRNANVRSHGLKDAAAAIERLTSAHESVRTDDSDSQNGGEPGRSTNFSKFAVSGQIQSFITGTEGYSSGSLGNPSNVPDGWLDAGRLASEGERGGQDGHDREPRGPAGFLITGGEDCKIRFWDLGKPERSVVVGSQDEKTDFKMSVNEGQGPSCYIHYAPVSSSSRQNSLRSPLLAHQQTQQAQSCMRIHKDSITALAVIEVPFRCIVAGDRTGAIKVWE